MVGWDDGLHKKFIDNEIRFLLIGTWIRILELIKWLWQNSQNKCIAHCIFSYSTSRPVFAQCALLGWLGQASRPHCSHSSALNTQSITAYLINIYKNKINKFKKIDSTLQPLHIEQRTKNIFSSLNIISRSSPVSSPGLGMGFLEIKIQRNEKKSKKNATCCWKQE